jgi:chromosome segregation ATPase
MSILLSANKRDERKEQIDRSLESINVQLKRVMGERKSSMLELRERVSSKQRELDEARHQCDEWRRRYDALSEQYHAERRQKSQLVADVADLTVVVQQYRTKFGPFEKKKKKKKRHGDTRAAESDDDDDDNDDDDDDDQDYSQGDADGSRSSMLVEETSMELEDVVCQVSSFSEKSVRTIQSHEKELSARREQIEQLKSDVKEAQGQRADEMYRLKASLSSAIGENARLSAELASSERVGQLEEQLAKLTDALRVKEIYEANLLRDLARLDARLRSALNDAKSAHERRAADVQRSGDETRRLTDEIDTLRQEVAAHRTLADTLRSQLDSATAQIDSLNSQVAVHVANERQLREQIDQFRSTVATLAARLKQSVVH